MSSNDNNNTTGKEGQAISKKTGPPTAHQDDNKKAVSPKPASIDGNNDNAFVQLLGMGFDESNAKVALTLANGHVEMAANYLLTTASADDNNFQEDSDYDNDQDEIDDWSLDGRLILTDEGRLVFKGNAIAIGNKDDGEFYFTSTERLPWLPFGPGSHKDSSPSAKMCFQMKGTFPPTLERTFHVNMTWRKSRASGRTIDPHAKTTGDDPLEEDDVYFITNYFLTAWEIGSTLYDKIEFTGSFMGGRKQTNIWLGCGANVQKAASADTSTLEPSPVASVPVAAADAAALKQPPPVAAAASIPAATTAVLKQPPPWATAKRPSNDEAPNAGTAKVARNDTMKR